MLENVFKNVKIKGLNSVCYKRNDIIDAIVNDECFRYYFENFYFVRVVSCRLFLYGNDSIVAFLKLECYIPTSKGFLIRNVDKLYINVSDYFNNKLN